MIQKFSSSKVPVYLPMKGYNPCPTSLAQQVFAMCLSIWGLSSGPLLFDATSSITPVNPDVYSETSCRLKPKIIQGSTFKVRFSWFCGCFCWRMHQSWNSQRITGIDKHTAIIPTFQSELLVRTISFDFRVLLSNFQHVEVSNKSVYPCCPRLQHMLASLLRRGALWPNDLAWSGHVFVVYVWLYDYVSQPGIS